MPAPHPKEFRDDVVAFARKGEVPIAQLAKDFGISESCLRNWLKTADVEDGIRPGTTKADSDELKELKRRNRAGASGSGPWWGTREASPSHRPNATLR
jgi:transposase